MYVKIIKDITKKDSVLFSILVKYENSLYVYANYKEPYLRVILKSFGVETLKELEGKIVREFDLPLFNSSLHLVPHECYELYELVRKNKIDEINKDNFILREDYQLAFYTYSCYNYFFKRYCL